jgi:predicted Zn-dependent protease
MRYGASRATCAGMEMFASLFLVAAQLLFQTGVQDAESGKLERARLTLQTLVNTYPQDPLAPSAKAEIEVIELFQEGERLIQEGRFDAAAFTFHTLISVYPESPLVKQAEAAMQAAVRSQEDLNVRLIVRALDLSGLGLTARDTESLFTDREVRLAAGKAFDPRDVEQARMVLTEFLKAKVRTEVRMAGAHEVDVVLARVD